MTSSSASSLERGLYVLDLLLELDADPIRRTQSLSVQQVAVELGVHKSTASRLMQRLVAAGYAVPSPGQKRGFRLGPSLQSQSTVTEAQHRMIELARPYLTQMVEFTSECAHLAVASGPMVLVLDDLETDHSLRVVAGKGRRVPLHCTSAGKVLMAYGLAHVPDDLPPRTPKTIVSADILARHLRSVVDDGYAVDDEENNLGVRCISAPIFAGVGGAPLGCVGIDGPTVRMTDSAMRQLVKSVSGVAWELTKHLSPARAKSPHPLSLPQSQGTTTRTLED